MLGAACAFCCLALIPPAAHGELPAPGRMGGGSARPGDLLVSLSSVSARSALYRIVGSASCGRHDNVPVTMAGTLVVQADGGFVEHGRMRAPSLGSPSRLRGSFRLTGTMTGPQPGDWISAGGTIAGRATFRSGRRTRRCPLAGNGGWSARQQTFPAGAPLTVPLAGPLFGITGQREGANAYADGHSVVVHPWKPAGRIYLVWEARAYCRGRAIRLFPFVNTTPPLQPDAQGAFQVHERFAVRYADGLSRFRADTAGRLLADGATGTIRLRGTLYKGRHVLKRCDSRTISWTAGA